MAMTSFAVMNARGQQAASPQQTATPQQPATGRQTDQLQQQLQLLKQQYDATTHDLEQRISALEQQIEKQKEKEKEEKEAREKSKEGMISAAELAAEGAANAVLGQSDQVGAKFQGQLPSEPSYDLLREADVKIEKLQEQLNTFEFHGYFRSGYGLNSQGGQQVAFQAPGAGAKYRLGERKWQLKKSSLVPAR
jgi:maltoporin